MNDDDDNKKIQYIFITHIPNESDQKKSSYPVNNAIHTHKNGGSNNIE